MTWFHWVILIFVVTAFVLWLEDVLGGIQRRLEKIEDLLKELRKIEIPRGEDF